MPRFETARVSKQFESCPWVRKGTEAGLLPCCLKNRGAWLVLGDLKSNSNPHRTEGRAQSPEELKTEVRWVRMDNSGRRSEKGASILVSSEQKTVVLDKLPR